MEYFMLFFGLVSLAGAWLALRYYLHMFQLNSYKPGVQLRWTGKNWKKLLLLCVPVGGGFFFWPRKAKKPLVITARVKRLIVSAAALQLLCLAAFFLLFHRMGTFLFENVLYYAQQPANLPLRTAMIGTLFSSYLLQLAAPWTVLLADFITKPIERAIRQHYINDAKKKLASAPNLTVIGITGSFGKTSVKHYLNTLLRAQFHVLMTPGGANVPMSVVRTIREELTAAHEIFLCEMGAKNIGDIKELCDIVRPRHGVLTSIGPQHLESFKTLENVIATKFELGDALPEGGILFANGEDENVAVKIGQYPRVITYASSQNGSDYYAEDIQVSDQGTSFTLVAPGGERERFSTRLIGRHNVVNLVGAVAVAHTLGVPLQSLKGQMRKIDPVPHRLQLIDTGGTLIIDDAYNSNPTGAKAALDTLALFDGMKILITPGMIELGPMQAQLNRAFGAQAAAVCDVIALVGAAQPKPIREGILAAGFPPEKLLTEETFLAARDKVYGIPSGTRKIILLENDLPDNY